jgi:hypothetical protein
MSQPLVELDSNHGKILALPLRHGIAAMQAFDKTINYHCWRALTAATITSAFVLCLTPPCRAGGNNAFTGGFVGGGVGGIVSGAIQQQQQQQYHQQQQQQQYYQ